MKKIRIPIGELYKRLGIKHNGEREETHSTPCDVYVKTPEETLSKINFFVTKKSDIYTYELENGERLETSDKHKVISGGEETLISEAKSIDNKDGKSYKIIKSYKEKEDEVVYDFGIDAPHLYTTPDGSIHHNTTVASIIFLYDLARLLCMDEPQLRFKLPKSAKIYFTLTNSTMENIEQVNYDPIMSLVRESPFFRSKFDNTKSRSSLFINNIDINMVSRKHSLVGKNVYAASSDEVNQEIQKGGSKNIITEMYNRINSRFLLKGNKWAGHYTMISSATTEGSLIQTMIDNAKEKSEAEGKKDSEFSQSDILVISAPRFEVLKHKIKYSGETFKVFIGDYQSDPFFIENDKDLERAKRFDPTKIFDVPIEYRGEFDDIYAGIRDVLGMAVSDVRTFIPFKEKIKNALVLHGACELDEIILGENDNLIDFFDVDKIDMFKPGSQKVIGLDIAVSGDRYGLCMSHIHDTVGEGELKEFSYWVDFAVGIRPPKGEQLKLYKIREFIFELQRLGINIEYVVSDSYQSTDTLQLLEKGGIKTIMNSVDRKKDPYVGLRNAIIDERIKGPNNQILYRELVFLKEDDKKVDHPEHNQDGTPGSKDIADAVTNSIWILGTKVDYKPYLDKDFIEELDEVVGNDWYDEAEPFSDIFGEGVTGQFVN